MKKFKNIALLGATALVGVVGFSACSSDDDPTSNTIEATGETVKTTFTLSIADQATTRMEALAAQETNVFSGITGIYLFPFITSDVNTLVAGTDHFSLSAIKLTDFDQLQYNSIKAKVYKDVTIPVGTNHFLFYGKKTNGQGGALTASFEEKTLGTADQVDSITIDLVPYNKDLTFATIDATAEPVKTILAALNGITEKLSAAATTNNGTFGTYFKNWKDLKTGASLTIAEAVEDLYGSMKRIGNGATTEVSNAAAAVCTEIDNYFTMTNSSSSSSSSATPTTADDYSAAWKDANIVFPTADMNLPDGAVGLKYDANNGFQYAAVEINSMTQPELNTYVKPAILAYYANTPIGISDKEQSSKYNSESTWANVFSSLYGNANAAVKTSTKSIILKDQIQYAVGRMDTQVKIGTDELLDSGSGVSGAADVDPQPVIVPQGGYTLTGILIGGQRQADWEFKPIDNASQMTIYDNKIKDTDGNDIKIVRGSYSNPNHTLALETESSEKVRICLEFMNSGDDFYGFHHEIVSNGTKFYLVAELDPSAGNPTVTQPEGAGASATAINQVFKQDYTTTVKLTIGQKSLQNAYQTIPDLRSPKLELGLSVNLDWEKGLTFEQTF